MFGPVLVQSEGSWCMLTLTTQPSGGKGFQIYIDDRLAAEVKKGERYTGQGNYDAGLVL